MKKTIKLFLSIFDKVTPPGKASPSHGTLNNQVKYLTNFIQIQWIWVEVKWGAIAREGIRQDW